MRRLATLFSLLLAFIVVAFLHTARGTAEYSFAVNGEFDANISGWTNPGSATLTWLASADRAGSPTSGGMEVRVAPGVTVPGGSYQCVAVTPGISYSMDAEARVPLAAQSPGTFAYLYRVYYSNPGCSAATGQFLAGNLTNTAQDGWQSLSNDGVAPPGAQSMWIYMVLNQGTQGVEAYGYFDDVTVTAPGNLDDDACSDGEELGPDPSFGGDRNPNYGLDFFDVTGDMAIDLGDATAVLAKFGLIVGDPGYDPAFDRFAPDESKPWRTAAATGTHLGIDLSDALVNLQSFGHSCVD